MPGCDCRSTWNCSLFDDEPDLAAELVRNPLLDRSLNVQAERGLVKRAGDRQRDLDFASLVPKALQLVDARNGRGGSFRGHGGRSVERQGAIGAYPAGSFDADMRRLEHQVIRRRDTARDRMRRDKR